MLPTMLDLHDLVERVQQLSPSAVAVAVAAVGVSVLFLVFLGRSSGKRPPFASTGFPIVGTALAFQEGPASKFVFE